MSQYIYTMNHVSKVVPPKRQILKDISLSFYPGAKIGLLGLNGAGKSTVLKIMAGVDKDFEGEARPQPGIKVGYLAQEPELDPEHTVREAVEEGVGEVLQAQAALDAVYAAYAEEGADFDALAKEQERLEAILAAGDAATLEQQLDVPPMRCGCRRGMRSSASSPVAKSAAWRCVACCCKSRTCCCWTNRPTTWTPSRWNGWNSSWPATPAPWWPSPMTATSWTTPPNGSWSWTAAAASRGRATTPTG